MTNKELKGLKRVELLEMLISSTKENAALRDEIEQLKEQLADRSIITDKAGSIAEASLQLNGVFSAAEAAAAQYLDNIRNQEQVCRQMQEEAEAKAARTLSDAEQKANAIVARAKQESDRYWKTVSQRLEKYCSEHKELQNLLSGSDMSKK